MKLVLDTSALISLAAGGILEMVVESLECIVPQRVKAELKGLSNNNDFEGNMAKEVITYLGNEITVMDASQQSAEGELECAYLAGDIAEVEFLITDDTKALEKLEKVCSKKIRFSTMIVYALYLKGKITKKEGIQITERIRVKRDWKDNIIFEQAQLLWQSIK